MSSTVIAKSKAIFCRYGIPEVNFTDNGPQFTSMEYAVLCKKYGIQHITSSPYYPQGNGKAEAAVKVVKSLMKKADDYHLALLRHRNTPPQGHSFSPVQRCFGRRTQHILPAAKATMTPGSHYSRIVQGEIAERRGSSKAYYDKGVKLDLKKFSSGRVRICKATAKQPWPSLVVR